MAMLAPTTTDRDLKLELKTYDDLLAIPDDGNRYELIFGEIFMSPSPATKHQFVLGELNERFRDHVLKKALGVVFFAPVDVKFSMYSVVEPDLIVVSRERVEIVTEKNVDGVPDVVVEILSPSNRMQDLVRKAALYAQYGVPEYWIVDPETDRITVNQLREGQYSPLPIRGGIARSTVLPGLKIRVSDIFTIPEWMAKSSTEKE
jgi:Uma2 family endonuclease